MLDYAQSISHTPSSTTLSSSGLDVASPTSLLLIASSLLQLPQSKSSPPTQAASTTTTTLHENVNSSAQTDWLQDTSNGSRKRRITDAGHHHPGFSTSTMPWARSPTLTFTAPSSSNMNLAFPPRPAPRPPKRRRATSDIDGDHSCIQKKKRRLRLFLITSRLSPQFSHPATNIVDRGSSKIAVWAKQKALGRNLLRKAAILNRLRRRASFAKAQAQIFAGVPSCVQRGQADFDLARLEFNHGAVDTYTRPVLSQQPAVLPTAAIRAGNRIVLKGSPNGSPNSSRSSSPTPPTSPRSHAIDEDVVSYRSPNEAFASSSSPPRSSLPRKDYIPLPPSPLGLSNYDAFDLDDDHYAQFDDDDEAATEVSDSDQDMYMGSFSSATTTATSPTLAHVGARDVLKLSPQPFLSDFSMLGHEEPVFGDYDQIDDGADAVWPSTFAREASASTMGSTSPDFTALFATSPPTKRTDSFSTSPNFRPVFPESEFAPPKQSEPAQPSYKVSPNFAVFESPNSRP